MGSNRGATQTMQADLRVASIALNITMFAPAVSASQVSAGALVSQRKNGDGCYGRDCHCSYQCYGKPGTLHLAKLRHCTPDIRACLAKCKAEKEAARR
jgi:hypothetical protein